LRATLPPDQVIIYQNEVQVRPEPEGRFAIDASRVSGQAVTPEDNKRRLLAVSMLARSSRLMSRPTRRRNSEQVHCPFGGPVSTVASMEGDTCDFRQRNLSQESRGPGIGGAARQADRAALLPTWAPRKTRSRVRSGDCMMRSYGTTDSEQSTN